MKKQRSDRKLIVIAIISIFIKSVSAQETLTWLDITLYDTTEYAQFSTSSIYNYKYPPSNLFDANYNTCWVVGSDRKKENPSLFLKLPDLDDIVVNIFSGYGKNKNLFYQNSMPRDIRFTVFAGINPDGYVSQYGSLYKAVEFPEEKIIHIPDKFDIQSINLDFSKKKLSDFEKKVYESYKDEFTILPGETVLILKMEILESWPGTKYDDICISEIFFNDCLISPQKLENTQIEKIYLNPLENTLLIDDNKNQEIVVYSDSLAVLQIIEVSNDQKWAILISMPAEIEGRTQTEYLLLDLVNKKVLNPQLEKISKDYTSGSAVYFEYGDYNKTYLVKDKFRIELR